MNKDRTWRRSMRRVTAVAAVGMLVVAGPACSKDDKSDSASTTLDVNADPPNHPPNDPPTTAASTTTPADTEPVSSTTTEAVSGEPFGGAVDGQDGGVDISFTRADGVIRNFAVRNLEIQCLPLSDGEVTTRTIDVVIDRVPVGADGLVDFTDEDADFSPQLSGSFADDGQFIGGVYLSQQIDDAVCGGEYTFELGG